MEISWLWEPGTGGSQNGQVQAGNVLNVPLSLNSGVTNLAAGVYYELLQVSDSLSQNSPQYVTAVLDVVPASTTVLPTVTPGGLLFVGAVGGTIAAQTLTVNWSSTQAQVVQAVASLPAGQSWVNLITPAGGVASTGSPLVMSVNVSTAGLAAGVYQGTINLFGIGPPALESVNVTLILTPSTAAATAARTTVHPQAVNPQSVRPQAAVGGCTPSALVLTETGIPNDFSVPAGWPADLVTVMADDCGNPIEGGSVAANFSNGDPPLALGDQGTGGQYVGTWQPSNLSNTIVTLNGAAGTLKPATAKLTGLVTPNQAPFLAPNGILNNSNPLVGAALAPGTVAEAFGLGLTTSANPVAPGVSPLLTQFQNSQLIVGGFVAPLYFLSNTQLDIELPAELATLQQYPAVSVVNGALSLPVQVSVIPASPGVAAYMDGSAIAEGLLRLIDSSRSAHLPDRPSSSPNPDIGATNPPVASDQVGPGNNPGDILAQAVVQPVVEVDNQIAKILFAGLTPGAIGLYQIDFYVPMGTAAGNATLTVSQGGVNANTTTLPVVTP